MRTRLRMGWLLVAIAAGALVATAAWAQDEAAPTEEAAPADEAAPTQAAGDEGTGEEAVGAELYVAQCARCHGEGGQADTRMGERFGIRPFTAAMMTDLGEEGIRLAIVEGRENMRPTTDLTDEQLAALSHYTFLLGR